MSETMKEVMETLAETIRKAPADKREEIHTFLRGYTAALENLMSHEEE